MPPETERERSAGCGSAADGKGPLDWRTRQEQIGTDEETQGAQAGPEVDYHGVAKRAGVGDHVRRHGSGPEGHRSDHEQDRDGPVAGHGEVPEPRYKWLNPPVSSFDMGTVTGCLAK
jgi:hypothetical protein